MAPMAPMARANGHEAYLGYPGHPGQKKHIFFHGDFTLMMGFNHVLKQCFNKGISDGLSSISHTLLWKPWPINRWKLPITRWWLDIFETTLLINLIINYEFVWTWGMACNLSSFHGKVTTNRRILGHRLFGPELGVSVDLTPRFWVEHGPALAMGKCTYEVFLSFSGKFHGIVFFPTPIVRFDYRRVVKNEWIYIANNTGRLPNKI